MMAHTRLVVTGSHASITAQRAIAGRDFEGFCQPYTF